MAGRPAGPVGWNQGRIVDVTPLFNAVDVGAVIALILGVFLGLVRRLSGELAHLISVVVAFVAGLLAFRPVAAWLAGYESLGPRTVQALAFVIIVVGAGVLMILLRLALLRAMRGMIGEEADRLLGGLAGLIRSIVVITVVFVLMNLVPSDFLNRQFGEASAIGRVVREFMPAIEEKLPEIEKKVPKMMELGSGEENDSSSSRRRR
jgi:membrane protein required for colicin V production